MSGSQPPPMMPPMDKQRGHAAHHEDDHHSSGGGDDSTPPAMSSPAPPHSSAQAQQQQVNLQAQPVNFNNNSNVNYPSRRVTIGHSTGGGNTSIPPPPPLGPNSSSKMSVGGQNLMGGSGSMMGDNRRGSMNSGFGNMEDFFGRRPSFGFDMGMDSFFGRRDSMDSTTAALDAAIMDLSRRRYSAAISGPVPTSNVLGPPGTSMGSMNMGSMGNAHYPSHGLNPGAMMPPPQGSQTHESITQRQQQLQQQQRELEQRQKELEFQRQQLIASMQERSYGVQHQGGGMMHHHRGSLEFGGSMGLGSIHSHGSGSLPPLPQMHSSQHHHVTQMPVQHRNNNAPSVGSGGSGSQQWWICQICSSKAFASHEEAMAHEAVCQDGSHRGVNIKMDPMHPLPMHSQDMMMGMGRNYSMGLGMDNSQRGMSMGMGIENSTRGVVSMGMDSSRGGGSMGFDSSRNMSLGIDSSSGHQSYLYDRTMSMGPFAMLSEPIPLAMSSDKDWLTPLHCFVRGHCVEVFTATESDVSTPSKGKRKPIQVGQVGIRCPHCRVYDSSTGTNKMRERGSVYYPTTIASIYNATMNLLQRHLHNCPSVPDDVMRRYETLKADDARSGTSKRYWIESALSLGLVDTPNGIRHSALRPPPLPTLTRQQETTGQDVARRSSNEFFGTKSNAMSEVKDAPSAGSEVVGGDESVVNDSTSKMECEMANSAPLVTIDDKPYATLFSYHLMSQMQPCVFTEADRLGKRKGLPPGFPGLACRHCFGGYGSGRFFPSSIKTLSDTSKTLNVLHNHMMRCRKCPADVKENLEGLRGSHDDERAKMKFGSQKAFFGRIWERLHGKDHPSSMKVLAPNARSPPKSAMAQQQMLYQGYGQQQMYVHEQQDQHVRDEKRGPPSSEGLDALAAASSPSKRQKLDS